MLKKTVATGGNVEVTFRMPPMDEVVELFLCGDFNNWHTSGTPLVPEDDGTWVTTLLLKAGRSYRFRYYDNQGRWHNDWEADAYMPNDFGTEDSVVDLTALAKSAPQKSTREAQPQKKPATRKAAPTKRPRKTGR
jgi:1,4-alpha-glucan branching enzyme